MYEDDWSETISVTPNEDGENLGAYVVITLALVRKMKRQKYIDLLMEETDTGTMH